MNYSAQDIPSLLNLLLADHHPFLLPFPPLPQLHLRQFTLVGWGRVMSDFSMGSRKMQFGLNIVNVSLCLHLLYACSCSLYPSID